MQQRRFWNQNIVAGFHRIRKRRSSGASGLPGRPGAFPYNSAPRSAPHPRERALPAVAILTFAHLRKAYASTVAVDDISFEVRSGEVFGLLGPNGAGKSTLIRMLMDIIRPDAGSIHIDGRPLQRADLDRIGYLPEERGLYRREKVQDILLYFAQLKGLDRRTARSRIDSWLERVGLPGAGARRVHELSKGMQQKVQIAGTLLHEPEVVVMDEPFSGLDPINTVLIKDLLRDTSRAGGLVVLSTHQMDMVEALCDRVAMVNRGRLVLYGGLDEIRERHGEMAVLVDAGDGLETLAPVARIERRGRLTRAVLRPGATPRDLMEALTAHRVPITHFETWRAPMEEIFVRTIEEGEGAP